jgi:hypothetical protein
MKMREACSAVACFGRRPCRSADISGKWKFNLISFGEEIAHANVELKLDGNKLSGTLNELKLEGTVQGETLKFTATRLNGERLGEFEGHMSGTELTGKLSRGGTISSGLPGEPSS